MAAGLKSPSVEHPTNISEITHTLHLSFSPYEQRRVYTKTYYTHQRTAKSGSSGRSEERIKCVQLEILITESEPRRLSLEQRARIIHTDTEFPHFCAQQRLPATDRLDLKINMEFRLNPISMKRGAEGKSAGITAVNITQLPNYMLTALCAASSSRC